MSNLQAIRDARYVYERAENMSTQELLDAAVSLFEWRIFSKRHIAAITGVRWPTISGLLDKSDRTGGKFSPEGLEYVERYMTTGSAEYLATAVSFCSPGLVGKFVGEPEWTVRRKVARLGEEMAT